MKKVITILMLIELSFLYAITPAGLDLIKQFEGLALKAYLCPANVLTIGYGDTKHARKGMTITIKQAELWLIEECTQYEASVLGKVKRRPLKWNERDALTVFTYNLGKGALKGELLSAVNTGNTPLVISKIRLYNKARVKGKLTVLRGLERRRNAEAKLYEGIGYE